MEDRIWLLPCELAAIERCSLSGDFKWFRDMLEAQWKWLCEGRSAEGTRMFVPPVTQNSVEPIDAETERQIPFDLPPSYRQFLRDVNRSCKPDSRLLLTNWKRDPEEPPASTFERPASDEAGAPLKFIAKHGVAREPLAPSALFGDEEGDEPFNAEGEYCSFALRLERAAFETAREWRHIAQDRSLSWPQDWGSPYVMAQVGPLHVIEPLSSCRLRRIHAICFGIRWGSDMDDAIIPRLIPIANGLQHYYMFESKFECDSVVAFHGRRGLVVVAETLAEFLLRYFNHFTTSFRGFEGASGRRYDYESSWAPDVRTSRASDHKAVKIGPLLKRFSPLATIKLATALLPDLCEIIAAYLAPAHPNTVPFWRHCLQ